MAAPNTTGFVSVFFVVMENINIFLSFTCYSFPTSCGNINLFQNDCTVIFRQNIVFVYVYEYSQNLSYQPKLCRQSGGDIMFMYMYSLCI